METEDVKKFWFLIIVAAMAAGCGHKKVPAPETGPSPVLHVYNWEDYLAPDTLTEFEKRSGIKVILATFPDENYMVSEIQSHPDRHDVIVASDKAVWELKETRLLAELDFSRIPNFKNVDSRYRNPPYDPFNRRSVPYLWGVTGMVVNRNFIKENADDWAILFNPRYQGRIAMLNNSRETISAALKHLGYPVNTKNPSELEAARQVLLKQKPLLQGYFDPIAMKNKLISGELWAAHIYSGEGMFAVNRNAALEFVIPREGSVVWVDNLAVPRDARHKAAAEAFINYLLEPQVSAGIANYLRYANCNSAARSYTLPEILRSPELYPPEEILNKCEFLRTAGSTEEDKQSDEICNRIWSELMLAH